MGKTKRVRKAGRLGARYGVGIRKKLLKVEDKQKKYYSCPSCGFERARRDAAGLYNCRKCKAKFAGGAYIPVTLPGSIVQKMVSQRSFLPKAKELIVATEKTEKETTKEEKHEKKETKVEEKKKAKTEEKKETKKEKKKEKPAKKKTEKPKKEEKRKKKPKSKKTGAVKK